MRHKLRSHLGNELREGVGLYAGRNFETIFHAQCHINATVGYVNST